LVFGAFEIGDTEPKTIRFWTVSIEADTGQKEQGLRGIIQALRYNIEKYICL